MNSYTEIICLHPRTYAKCARNHFVRVMDIKVFFLNNAIGPFSSQFVIARFASPHATCSKGLFHFPMHN
jgi:hypothetical protein